MTSLLIGIASFHDVELLRKTLPQVAKIAATHSATVVVLNNGLDAEVSEFLNQDFPQFHELRPERNLGFGAGYNFILQNFPGHEIFCLLTNDVWVDEAGFAQVLAAFQTDSECAAMSGKIHIWNIEQDERTEKIDSLGIRGQLRHHFYDWAHGELDRGQFDEDLGEIFGLSGAIQLIRISKIPLLFGSESQLFSENLFIYKEDIDLAYRWRWLGERIRILPVIWAWHARTTANKMGLGLRNLASADSAKSSNVRRWSYTNHFRILKMHWSRAFGLSVLARVVFYEFAKAFFMLFRDPKTLFIGLRTLLFERVEPSNKRVNVASLLTFFD